jgi:hypothetical protein
MELSQSLLEAGLLSFLSLLLLTSSPAAAQHAGHNGPRHHAHLPRMQPAQQKLQSLLQEPALGRTANAMAAEATALTGLLPACVPKYETDLVIPAPMPVSLVPLRKVGPLLSVGASLLLSGITQVCAMGTLPVGQHMRTHINSSDVQPHMRRATQ